MGSQELKNCDYKILLMHEPDAAERLPENSADLILAGHSHGGQVKLPFFKMKRLLPKNIRMGFIQ